MRRIYYPALVPTAHLMAGVIALASQGCARKLPSDQAVEHTVKKIPTGNLTEQTRETKEHFEGELKLALEKLDEEVREMQVRAGAAKEAAKAELKEAVKDLEAKQKAARAKLDEIGKASSEAWQELREGGQNALQELENAVREARSKF